MNDIRPIDLSFQLLSISLSLFLLISFSHTKSFCFPSFPSIHPSSSLSILLSISSLPKINQEQVAHHTVIFFGRRLFRSTSFWKLIEAFLLSLSPIPLYQIFCFLPASFLSNSIPVPRFILFSSLLCFPLTDVSWFPIKERNSWRVINIIKNSGRSSSKEIRKKNHHL